MQTILIVDDESRIRRIYKYLFERKGYRVFDAPNIVDARKFLKAIPVDLLLLDINMGEFGGDILYEITSTFHQNVKIITASVYPIDDQKKVMPEAADYFDKSDSLRRLIEKVNRLMRSNQDSNRKEQNHENRKYQNTFTRSNGSDPVDGRGPRVRRG